MKAIRLAHYRGWSTTPAVPARRMGARPQAGPRL